MASLYDEILESFGINNYDNLNSSEQETLRGWVEKVEKSVVTIEDVKIGVKVMREVLEAELVNLENNDKKDIFLKARLKNMILIETILTRQDKARAALDMYVRQGKAQIAK